MPNRKPLAKNFEIKRKNPIELGDDSNLETNLKPIKIGGKNSILELSDGELKVRGTIDASVMTIDGASVHAGETISSVPDLNLNPKTGKVNFQTNGATIGYIDTSGSTMKIESESGRHTEINSTGTGDVFIQSGDNITIDATDFLLFDSDGRYMAKQNGTEFSVANSAYAGMILGYRMIGEGATHTTYTLTTYYAVPDSAMTVRFVAPPSGNVEVMVQVYHNASSSNRTLHVGLSDNATYNSLGSSYECMQNMPDETNDQTIQHFWTVTGLTAGDTYNYWFGAKTSATNNYLAWGGTGAGRFCDFIMKVTALPADTSDFAEYN